MNQFKIFVVEDDTWYASFLSHYLSLNNEYSVEKYTTGKDCLNNLHKKPSIITLDFSLPDMTGKELLIKIKQIHPEIPVIIISGQDDITTAVDLIKQGACDYIVKNDETTNRLWNTIRLQRENISLKTENERLKKEVSKKYDFSKTIIGESKELRKVFEVLEKAADTPVSVTITGETGTGKELIANAIHFRSSRNGKPFVAVNIGAIPKELVESELFGYEKGAYTGAHTRKAGIFEEASGGTIFLDEIAEMDLNIQSKFLRVLQEREVKRIGGSSLIKVDVRIITASHKNLAEEVQKGNFRTDLYYRIMGIPINLPPLRERGKDIIILAKHFADSYCKENNLKKVTFTEDAISKLLSYSYPGNIRELKSTIELSVVLSDSSIIDSGQINFTPAGSHIAELDKNMTLEEHMFCIIKSYLIKYGNNPTDVAKRLGISRATIYRYLKEMNYGTSLSN
ncbi:MAG: regulator [Bacteroidetes bacterium GWE2_39_28]|nr:MAG: regulator [Bacteroidetes bacterium GWE2_39_28]OFY15797.1 MAG: regulator [Bacteroidetes bacterium GWF2_39_10]OFZ06882.1 MAG: regulator [Bacteroidetes bacterium RIFOXYB2_FULL_39_7]OFZ09965.1 MAG: regulator [Bacteroidetes bacterium RIFOXYC2_FULL_39_11]HCT93508.1 regulator [Rikenellaceae bacterium]